MRIRLGNWTIDFSKQRKWWEFWWIPNDGLIRREAMTSFDGVRLEREFYTLRSFVMTAWELPKLGARMLAQKLTLPQELAFQLGVIALDVGNSGGPASSTLTYSHTVTGVKTLLVATLGATNSPSTGTLTAATYNAVGLNLADSETASLTDKVFLYYLIAPTSGANNVSFSFDIPTSMKSTAISYTGADQNSPLDAHGNHAGGATNSITITLTQTNCMVSGGAHGFSTGNCSLSSSMTDEASIGGATTRPVLGYDGFQSASGSVTATVANSDGTGGSKHAVAGFRSSTASVPFKSLLGVGI